MASRPTAPAAPSRLKGANVLILDDREATARLIRSHVEDRGAAHVEVATGIEEALDILGRASRPILLAMMDTLSEGAACVQVLRILRQHQARVHVTLHGRWPPEKYAVPRNLLGAAAYTHQATASIAVATAEEVIGRGLTVRRIIEDRVVPETLDAASAQAIYGAGPGKPFPKSLRV